MGSELLSTPHGRLVASLGAVLILGAMTWGFYNKCNPESVLPSSGKLFRQPTGGKSSSSGGSTQDPRRECHTAEILPNKRKALAGRSHVPDRLSGSSHTKPAALS